MPLTSPQLQSSVLLPTGAGEEAAISEQPFGPLRTTWELEQAAVSTLREWFPEYLAELERKNGLRPRTIPRPPAPESYHGGVDLDSWKEETLPEVIVVVEPVGEAERSASVGYVQQYDIQVGCVAVSQAASIAENPEHDSRAIASFLGAASMLLVQQPALAELAERVTMTAPRVVMPDPDLRQLHRSEATFHVWMAPIIRENESPLALPNPNGFEEPWNEEPVVVSEKLILTAEPVSSS